MNVLIACEFSGIVRDAFIERGHNAISCDILPSERDGPHILGDIREVDLSPFDLKLIFPPCTRLCRSGAQHWKWFPEEHQQAIAFFMWCVEKDFNVIENPIGCMSTLYRKPDQKIQPWMFGYNESKSTCLWLKDVPPLQPTKIVGGRKPKVHYAAPGIDRWKERSRTYLGVAMAMASQWG